MASYGPTAQNDYVRGIIAEAKGLTVDKLKRVLRNENLAVSGIKSELQVRLIAHIERCAQAGENDKLGQIRSLIKGTTAFSNPYPSPFSQNTPTSSLSPQFNSPTPRPPPPRPIYAMPPYTANRLVFRDSPFYNIQRPLSGVLELNKREQTRDTARLTLTMDPGLVEMLNRDPTARVMVFCAAESYDSGKHTDIAFPQHGELKCNSEEVKANLKGLKNKPGTTRPADITSYLKKKVGFPNSVELVYALTKNKFFMIVQLVQKKTVERLVEDLKLRNPLRKETVIRDMQVKAQDPDIVATSAVMSLKDPLQMTRIKLPCRGRACKHNQCFDASSFLYLQEQAPTWTCPICSRASPWDMLVLDYYFDEILKNTPDSTEQVTVEPDGRWHKDEVVATGVRDDSDDEDADDDDDDLIEITDSRTTGNRESIYRTPSLARTPPISIPTPQLAPAPTSAPMNLSASRPNPNKRPHSVTIDLTESDDEDDVIQPPHTRVKRPSVTSSNNDSFPPPPSRNGAEPYRFQLPPPPNLYHNYMQGFS